MEFGPKPLRVLRRRSGTASFRIGRMVCLGAPRGGPFDEVPAKGCPFLAPPFVFEATMLHKKRRKR